MSIFRAYPQIASTVSCQNTQLMEKLLYVTSHGHEEYHMCEINKHIYHLFFLISNTYNE